MAVCREPVGGCLVESSRTAKLGEPAMPLAGRGRILQFTPQMRVLVYTAMKSGQSPSSMLEYDCAEAALISRAGNEFAKNVICSISLRAAFGRRAGLPNVATVDSSPPSISAPTEIAEPRGDPTEPSNTQ